MASQITCLTVVYSTVYSACSWRRSKKTSKLRVTGLCAGNSLVIGEFPTQMASNAENVSIRWCHHDTISIVNRETQQPLHLTLGFTIKALKFVEYLTMESSLIWKEKIIFFLFYLPGQRPCNLTYGLGISSVVQLSSKYASLNRSFVWNASFLKPVSSSRQSQTAQCKHRKRGCTSNDMVVCAIYCSILHTGLGRHSVPISGKYLLSII